MLTHLEVKNFKGFDTANFDLKPITLFLGANNSGKSAAISAFKLMAQTLDSYDRTIPLLLNGKFEDFGTYKDLVYLNNVRKIVSIGISSDTRTGTDPAADSGRQKTTTLRVDYKFKSKLKQIVANTMNVDCDGKSVATFKRSEDSGKLIYNSILGREIEAGLRKRMNEKLSFHHFLPNASFCAAQKGDDSKQIETARIISTYLRSMYLDLVNLDYLGPTRLPPARTYTYSGERHEKVGSSGENAMNILAMDALVRGQRALGIRGKVVDWLRAAGVAHDIEIHDLIGRFFSIQISKAEGSCAQNIADVGFGISQVLPVLVGAYNASPKGSFWVEEPEIHLHPKAQAELGELFRNMHQRKVQVVAETHSEYLVLRLLRCVAKGLIPHGDIVFYSVENDGRGSKIHRIDVDKKGRFASPWPAGFFPERLEEARQLSVARMDA